MDMDHLPATESAENPAPATSIDELIKSSQNKLREEEGAPLKRKRGRPRKVPAALDAEPGKPAEAVSAAPLKPLPDFKPMITDVCLAGSAFIVDQTRCERLALSEEERGRVCEHLNPLLQKWFPELGDGALSPELAALIGIGMLGFSKFMIYREWKKEQTAKAVVSEVAT